MSMTPEQATVAADNLGAVYAIVSEMFPRLPGSFEDMVSDAMLGLAEAASRFDPARGVKFPTYANARIRGSVLDEAKRRMGRTAPRPETVSLDALPVAMDRFHETGYEAVEDRLDAAPWVAAALQRCTPNVRRVAGLLSEGLGTKEVAEEMHVTQSYVSECKRHLRRELLAVAA